MTKATGTREWSATSVNCMRGCDNDCAYCFSRYLMVYRYKKYSQEEWNNPTVIPGVISKRFGKRSGTIMFPTMHDITPRNLDTCLLVLGNVLKPGNRVLIVSKPRIECVKRLCSELTRYKKQITFRFTIGASDDEILSYWEPSAPSYLERYGCLTYAYNAGYRVGISMEPVLDWVNLIGNVIGLSAYVNDEIWIGFMNDIDRRVIVNSDKDVEMIDQMKKWQTPEYYMNAYDVLSKLPCIRWKDSLRKKLETVVKEKLGEV